jgi:hypothetical protein
MPHVLAEKPYPGIHEFNVFINFYPVDVEKEQYGDLR